MLILGGVEHRKSHQLEKMQTCLSSLRRHNPTAKIVIFNRSPKDEALAALLLKYWAQSVDVTAWDVAEWGPLTSRMLYYDRWVHTQDISEPILMIDLFDVVAQGNLDTLFVGDKLVVAQENKLLGECPYNATWLRESFGIGTTEPMLAQSVICCGVMAGKVPAVQAYCRWFVRMLETQTRTKWPLDQSALNIYVYRVGADVELLPYRNTQMMHVGYADPETLTWTGTAGTVSQMEPLLLHQYNRHRPLLKAIRGYYA